MKNILALYSSINPDQSQSTRLAEQYLDEVQRHETVSIIRRDLSDGSVPHLDSHEFVAWNTASEERTNEQHKLAELSDTLIAELEAADMIVMTAPMYNFGIPSSLKAWIDRIARAGRTFKYTENGPVGLLNNKQMIIISSRGGKYAGTPMDTQTDYLRDVMRFVGITDISFIYAEGLATATIDDSLERALQELRDMVQTAVV
ncbi:MAG: FMN-dependent NADH-azoreductase [Enterobacterales bacterium]|nr:FMN-dependent NADH-azoreductase [Enterobacterales bacterium]